eukprot:COSAG02_NODE_178_length_31091_cov_59.242482_2_plen_56_part_00
MTTKFHLPGAISNLRFPEEKGCDRVSTDLPVDFLIDFCGCNFFIKQWMLQRILVL